MTSINLTPAELEALFYTASENVIESCAEDRDAATALLWAGIQMKALNAMQCQHGLVNVEPICRIDGRGVA